MTATTSRNEAAERLRKWAGFRKNIGLVLETIDAALAAERRATVQRIRTQLLDNHNLLGAEFYRLDQIETLLDEEAARG